MEDLTCQDFFGLVGLWQKVSTTRDKASQVLFQGFVSGRAPRSPVGTGRVISPTVLELGGTL